MLESVSPVIFIEPVIFVPKLASALWLQLGKVRQMFCLKPVTDRGHLFARGYDTKGAWPNGDV